MEACHEVGEVARHVLGVVVVGAVVEAPPLRRHVHTDARVRRRVVVQRVAVVEAVVVCVPVW